jgi:hypothetical protein
MPLSLGATSLATVMQMVASGYGVTLVPRVAVDVEVRDQRVKLLRFTAPEPGRTIGLAWRRTSPRKIDFVALGQIVVEALTGGSHGNRSARGSKMSRRKNKRFKHGIWARENAEMRKRQRKTLRRLRCLLSELKGE